LGGADVYGEADIFWYIPDTSTRFVESKEQLDLLQRQAILSGERMPIILTPNPVTLAKAATGTAWIGNVQGSTVCDETTFAHDRLQLPNVRACEYVSCDQQAQTKHHCDVYNSVCWVNRKDWNPTPLDTRQDSDAGHLRESYPNFRQHQWEGRKLALMVLQALDDAIDMWTEHAQKGNLPLKDSYWHVGDVYEELRSKIRTLKTQPGQEFPCEKLLADIDPMICHMSMHVATEWTPRVDPDTNVLSNFITSEYKDNSDKFHDLYTGVDLLPQEWRLSSKDVDVHMLAISTSEESGEKPPEMTFDDDFNFGDDATFGDDVYEWEGDDGFDWLTQEDDDWVGTDDFTEQDDDNFRRQRQLRQRKTKNIAKKMWTLHNRPIGFCDGSAQSMCNRRVGNTCLLANSNHYKAGFVGHGESDWLYMSLPIVEGIVMLRFDLKMNLDTSDQGDLNSLPDDFRFDLSIGGIERTLMRDEFIGMGKEIANDLIVHPVLNDKKMSREEGFEQLELGIRIRTAKDFQIMLTHVYYA
jgi:hypothetical protein